MLKLRVLVGSLALAVALTGAWSPVAAQGTKEPTKEELAQAADRADVVAQLATAANLAAFGRGELGDETGLKAAKSPEALVAAGGILLRINAATGGEMKAITTKPTNDKGETLKVELAKNTPLADEAKGLFDAARAMVASDKAKTTALEGLIKQAEEVTKRGACGGPRTLCCTANGGETHTYVVPFIGGCPAAVAMTSNGPGKIRLEILSPNGDTMFDGKGGWANYNWKTSGNANVTRNITIKVTNLGRNPTPYRVTTN